MMEFPEAFLRDMHTLLGAEYPDFLRALNLPPTRAIRINPKRPGAEALARAYSDAPVPWEKYGFYVAPDFKPGADIPYAAGAYYVQDASAMAPAAALSVKPGERVLDLCASPGGKSGQLAREADFLLSNEIDRGRAEILAGNLERLGVANAYVVNARPEMLSARLPGYFDAVLVDAPCSGEGMFRRDEGARRQWRASAPEGCAARQAEILREAAKMVRPGGRMVYSTCTFNRVENEGSVDRFLSEHPEFVPLDFSLPGVGASVNGMLRLWPHRVRGEGQFMARFMKTSGEECRFPRAGTAAETAARLISEDVLSALPSGDVQTVNGFLCLLPSGAPAPEAVCAPGALLRAGIPLYRAEKGYVRPEHALAMAVDPALARRTFALDEASARAYLAGETLCADAERGWTLMTISGLPLGWGKCVDGVIKNHLPKGLRRVCAARLSH